MIESNEKKIIDEALEILDKMNKKALELSYKVKDKSRDPLKISELRKEFLRDIFILRDINEKCLNSMHELLSESLGAEDLYSMIS